VLWYLWKSFKNNKNPENILDLVGVDYYLLIYLQNMKQNIYRVKKLVSPNKKP